MACNCGKNKTAASKYVYTDENGKATTYTSEIQAQAAKVRNKGRGSVKVVPA